MERRAKPEMPDTAREEQEGRAGKRFVYKCTYFVWPGETEECKITYLMSLLFQFASLYSPITHCEREDAFQVLLTCVLRKTAFILPQALAKESPTEQVSFTDHEQFIRCLIRCS